MVSNVSNNNSDLLPNDNYLSETDSESLRHENKMAVPIDVIAITRQ